jgi:hypothetical protein
MWIDTSHEVHAGVEPFEPSFPSETLTLFAILAYSPIGWEEVSYCHTRRLGLSSCFVWRYSSRRAMLVDNALCQSIEAPQVFQTCLVLSVRRHRISDLRSPLNSLPHGTSRTSTQSSSPSALVPGGVGKPIEPTFAKGEPVILTNVPAAGSYQCAVAGPLS